VARKLATKKLDSKSRRTCLSSVSNKIRSHVSILRERRSTEEDEERSEQLRRELSKRDRVPLKPAEWIENEYFCGPLARDMFDVLKEEFIDIYERNIFEVVMGGSIGWGKTTMSTALQLYSLYLLTCYGIPQFAFKRMMETAQILYMNLNVKKEKAFNSYFKDIDKLIKATPYFQKDFAPQKGLVHEIRFPQKGIISKYSGATKTAAESEHLIFLVLDEVNLYDKVKKSRRSTRGDEEYDAAEVVYTSGRRRMQSRFMAPDGSMPLPAKLITLCKETYKKSFIRNRMKEVRKLGLEAKNKVKIMEYTEWDTRPPGTYEKKYFWVRTGNRTESPRIILTKKTADIELKALEKLRKVPGVNEDELYDVKRCPLAGGEFLDSARKNLPDFIRDTLGLPTEALTMFMERREPIFEAVREPNQACRDHTRIDFRSEVCEHPFSEINTNFYDGVFLKADMLCDDVAVMDDDGKPLKDDEGKIMYHKRPMINPSARRFAHIDTGLTNDPCGIAVGHMAGWREVVRMIEGGAVVTERAPFIWYDLLLQVVPPPGGEIPFAGIRGLLYSLKKFGFNFKLVSLDSYQSRDFIQIMERKKFRCALVSIDETTTPYDRLKAAYMEGRISAYAYEPVEVELVELERMYTGEIRGGRAIEKVDHPPHGTKDIADAMAGVADAIENYAATMTTTIIPEKARERIKPRHEREYEKAEMFHSGDWESLEEYMRKEEER